MKRLAKAPLVTALALSTLAVSTGLANPAVAAEQASGLSLGCRGLALAIAGQTVADANPAFNPCASADTTVANVNLSLPLGGLNLKALQGFSRVTPGRAAEAAALIAGMDLTLLTLPVLQATALSAYAASGGSRCTVGTFGKSSLGSIKVLGMPIPVDGTTPRTVALPLGLGAVHINHQVAAGGSITQTAVFVDLIFDFLDVKIAQASTSASCTAQNQSQTVTVKNDRKPTEAQLRTVREKLEKIRDEKLRPVVSDAK